MAKGEVDGTGSANNSCGCATLGVNECVQVRDGLLERINISNS